MEKIQFQNEILNLLDSNDIHIAFERLQEYRYYFKQDVFYLETYADILLSLDEYQEAISFLNKISINEITLTERLADAYFGIGQFDRANSLYLKCPHNTLEDASFRILFMIASSYYNLENYKECISYYEDYLLDNEDVDAYFFCANAYLKIGEYKNAKYYYDSVLKLGTKEDYFRILDFLLHEKNEFMLNTYLSDIDLDIKYLYQCLLNINKNQMNQAYSYIQKIENITLQHYLKGIYYQYYNDNKNELYEFQCVLEMPNDKVPLDLIFSILKISHNDFSQYAYHLFNYVTQDVYLSYILNYLYVHEHYEACLKLMGTCSWQSSYPTEILIVILKCLMQLNCYEDVLNLIEFETEEPIPLEIIYIKIKALLKNGQIKEGIHLANDYMPNGKIAHLLISYYQSNAMEESIKMIKKRMARALENKDYIPDYDVYIDS